MEATMRPMLRVRATLRPSRSFSALSCQWVSASGSGSVAMPISLHTSGWVAQC